MEETAQKLNTKIRVLMFPWLAHGHISPFLELSKQLSRRRNFNVYFISTAINLNFIKKNFAQELSDHEIELVELQLPESSELPPHYHTTNNLPSHLISSLMGSFRNAKSSFSKILSSLSPDLIIYDGFQTWAPKLAAENHIPCIHFATSGAASLSFFYHLHRFGIDSDSSFPFSEVICLTDYERKEMKALQVEYKKSASEGEFARCFELSSEFVLIKSSKEFDEKYLDYLSFLCGKKMVTLGPLVHNHQPMEKNDHVDTNIIDFLNKKGQASVLLVSFGSEYYLSSEERDEIAHGLELSNVNFIWALRYSGIEEAFPEGFTERVKERGIIVNGWAPQAKILEHSSTGGFVSHCGWNSAMESLYYGVPIIAMPIHCDQPPNARLVVGLGVGMEVCRDENGKFGREEIARVIKLVFLEKSGEEMGGKARELSKKLRLRREEELDGALDEVWNLCRKNKQLINQGIH